MKRQEIISFIALRRGYSVSEQSQTVFLVQTHMEKK